MTEQRTKLITGLVDAEIKHLTAQPGLMRATGLAELTGYCRAAHVIFGTMAPFTLEQAVLGNSADLGPYPDADKLRIQWRLAMILRLESELPS